MDMIHELTFELSGAVKDMNTMSELLKTATKYMIEQQEEIVELRRQLAIRDQIDSDLESEPETDSETDSE
jgi:hypothetical protein